MDIGSWTRNRASHLAHIDNVRYLVLFDNFPQYSGTTSSACGCRKIIYPVPSFSPTIASQCMAQRPSKNQGNIICPILDLPVEIGRQVIQSIDSSADLHALSLSCKAFTEIAREKIFAHITFTFAFAPRFRTVAQPCGVAGTRLLGLSKMAVQTTYIKCISVLTESLVALDELIFSKDMQVILAEWLRQMTRLEKLVIKGVNLSECLVLAILDTTSRRSLSLQLCMCTFSVSLLQMLDIPIDIPKLDIQNWVEPGYRTCPVGTYSALERRSIAFAERLMNMARFNITTLRVDLNSPLALTTMLGSIFLPALRMFEWNSLLYKDEQLPAVMDGFFQRHSTITSISLAGEAYGFIPLFIFPSLTQVSPSLPNLQIIKTTSDFIHKLVPGRPVTEVSMICVEPSGFHLGIRALYHSTATIIKASLLFPGGNGTWDQVIETLAEATPSLQELDLRTISPAHGINVCAI